MTLKLLNTNFSTNHKLKTIKSTYHFQDISPTSQNFNKETTIKKITKIKIFSIFLEKMDMNLKELKNLNLKV